MAMEGPHMDLDRRRIVLNSGCGYRGGDAARIRVLSAGALRLYTTPCFPPTPSSGESFSITSCDTNGLKNLKHVISSDNW